jgi:hypothetical protein
MMYVLAVIGGAFALYLGCYFVIGFVQGFVGELTQPQPPKFHRLRCLHRVWVDPNRNSRAG